MSYQDAAGRLRVVRPPTQGVPWLHADSPRRHVPGGIAPHEASRRRTEQAAAGLFAAASISAAAITGGESNRESSDYRGETPPGGCCSRAGPGRGGDREQLGRARMSPGSRSPRRGQPRLPSALRRGGADGGRVDSRLVEVDPRPALRTRLPASCWVTSHPRRGPGGDHVDRASWGMPGPTGGSPRRRRPGIPSPSGPRRPVTRRRPRPRCSISTRPFAVHADAAGTARGAASLGGHSGDGNQRSSCRCKRVRRRRKLPGRIRHHGARSGSRTPRPVVGSIGLSATRHRAPPWTTRTSC